MSTKLDNKKWIVENYDGNKEIKVTVEKGQSVYIYNVKDSVVQITGKIAVLSCDKVTGSGVVFESAIGSAEVVNSKKLQLQGSAPQYVVDKSEGVTLYLKPEDRKSSVTHSLATEINIIVLEGDDPKESPVPSQFVTEWSEEKKDWVTHSLDHVGA